MLLPLLFSLLSLSVLRTSAVSPIFSPVLPNFRFVGEATVAGVVGLGGELRFFNKRDLRVPKKRTIPGFFERNFVKNDLPHQRGKPIVFARGEAGRIQELVQRRGKREANSGRVRREARLIKDPRVVLLLFYFICLRSCLHLWQFNLMC